MVAHSDSISDAQLSIKPSAQAGFHTIHISHVSHHFSNVLRSISLSLALMVNSNWLFIGTPNTNNL